MSEQLAIQPKALPLCEVYLYEEGVELPKSGMYYVVAKNGVFIHVERQVGSALVKADGIPWLENAQPSIQLKLPKIPGRIIGQALTFFRQVWDEYKAEAYTQLYYSKELNQYRLWVPKQKVSGGGVSYDRADQFDIKERVGGDVGKEIQKQWKWQMVGTIHSHCNFSAFHSGTDTHDEETFDGIHITLGHVDRKQFSMCASVAVNANRVTLDPENCTSGVVRKTDQKISNSQWMVPGDVNYFDFELSEEDTQGLVEDADMITDEWMPKVRKQVWKGWKGNQMGFFRKDEEAEADADADEWNWAD
jgi:hypothetical protein